LLFLGDYRHPEIIGAARHAGEREHGDMVGVVQDITERKEMEWRLEQEARTDALTGCSLRRYFMEVARRELGRIRRYGGKMSLLMLDLDYFKTVNDGYGHLVGDRALQKLVQVCRDALRQEDMIGRLGGEEFAILLIEAESDKAFEVAERIRQAVASTEIPLEMKPPLQFTVSIGVAGLIETDSSIEEIINRADQALYAAKRSGRNRVSRMAAVTG
jgi:diguanylate cyclase (GGDEF)-like protein